MYMNGGIHEDKRERGREGEGTEVRGERIEGGLSGIGRVALATR